MDEENPFLKSFSCPYGPGYGGRIIHKAVLDILKTPGDAVLTIKKTVTNGNAIYSVDIVKVK